MRAIALLLALFLIGPGLILSGPMAVEAASSSSTGSLVTPTASFVGVDTATQGNWVGVYGKDGYVLPYYTATVAFGHQSPTPADVAKLPSYVSGYSGTGVEWAYQNPTTDPGSLESPTGSVRKAVVTNAPYSVSESFTLTDTAPHLFTVYSDTYAYGNTYRFEIVSPGGQVLASQTVSSASKSWNPSNGEYVSFEVSGSFTLRVTAVSGGSHYVMLSGFFFDPIVPNTLSNVSVSPLPNRAVQINWNNGSNERTRILRKEVGVDTSFAPIAILSAGTSSYVDSNLTPGATYQYELQDVEATGPIASVPTSVYSVTLPAYTPTTLSFTQPSLTASAPGQPLQVQAVLKDVYGPVSDQTVTFTLQGPNVGTYISSVVGTAVTDANGAATVSYTPPYAGHYHIQATFPWNDAQKLAASSATIPLTVDVVPWTVPPTIFHSSDAVLPGQVFNLVGAGLFPDGQEAVAAPLKGETPPANTPSADATALTVVQSNASGAFMTVRLPASAAPGEYAVWVKNGFGWSTPFILNAPKPLWISAAKASAGERVTLTGRNLDAVQFGVHSQTVMTQVRLAPVSSGQSGRSYPVSLVRVNPYAVVFRVDHRLPVGQYGVEISNDGGQTWAPLSDGQSLQIVPQGPDPLHLGVAWASAFHWNRIFNVEHYGAMPNTGQDVTTAVQDAVNQAAAAGGGVVYFPAGTYNIHQVELPAYVVLEGAGPTATTLNFDGTGRMTMIQSVGNGITVGHQGIANLGLGVANPQVYPDSFLWLGYPYGATWYDTALRHSSDYFIDNTKLSYPLTWAPDTSWHPVQGRGMGLVLTAKQNVVIRSNDWMGYGAAVEYCLVNQYVDIQGNHFEYTTGSLLDTASYSLVEHNQLIGQPQYDTPANPAYLTTNRAIGFDLRSSYYVAHNALQNLGNETTQQYNPDGWYGGEQPGSPMDLGQVLGGTTNAIAVAPTVPFGAVQDGFGNISGTTTGATYNLPVAWSRLRVMIVGGQGTGQYRQVASITGNTITVTRPWTVVPNASSQFAFGTLGIADTVYQNSFTNTSRGLLLYGGFIGETVANNSFNGGSGVQVDAFYYGLSSGRDTPDYFDVVRNNVFTNLQQPTVLPAGVDESYMYGVGLMSANSGNTAFGLGAFGTEFTGNTLQYTQSIEPTKSLYVFAQSLAGDGPTIVDTIVQGNRFVNLNPAIVLTAGVADTVLSGNQYDNVSTDVNNQGAVNTVTTPFSHQDTTAPFWPTDSTVSVTPTGPRSVTLEWTPAVDTNGVTQYQVWVNGRLTAIVGANVTSDQLGDLKAGHCYRVQIQAGNVAGNWSLGGPTVKVRLAPNTPEIGSRGRR